MTESQYRCLVAYLRYWPQINSDFGLKEAIADIGITDNHEQVIYDLCKAGYDWYPEERRLVYIDDAED